MDFDHFLLQTDKLKAARLGGEISQFKMVPKERPKYGNLNINDLNPKKAAVLSLFFPDSQNKTCFLLTLRPNYKGVHSDQISFPGGKFESSDGSLTKTALRETHEEIGIDPEQIHIVRELSKTFIPPSNFLVSPFLGYLKKAPQFQTNHEVKKLIVVKLSDLLDNRTLSSKKLTTSYMENIDVPCFKLNNYIVWGATAMMLSEIKDLFSTLKFVILFMFAMQLA